jgi:hypothetical protein
MLVYRFLLSQPHRSARVTIQFPIRWVAAVKRSGRDVDQPHQMPRLKWVAVYLCCPDVPSWRGKRQLYFCLERARYSTCALFPSTSIKACRYSSMQACGFFVDPYDTHNCSFVSPRWLYGAKELCQALCQPLSLQGSRSLHILHAIARKWHKIDYGRNVLSRSHTVRNIADVRALGLCGLLIVQELLIFIWKLYQCVGTVIGDFTTE